MCPVDGDSLACLKSRATGKIVFFCPICGLAFKEPPVAWELNDNCRLDEFAPTGVVLPSRGELETAGATDLREMDGAWGQWVEDILWVPPPPGKADEEATKALFDRWYRGERGHRSP